MTEKQKQIYQRLKEVIEANKIKLVINPISFEVKNRCALDVEHNEHGEMVGIGIYDGLQAYYFTEINSALLQKLSDLDIITHNGVTDYDCLKQWGIPIQYSQLIWDTMLIGHAIDSSKKDYSLKGMAKRELALDYPDYDDIVGKHKGKTKKSPVCNKQQSDCCERVTLDKQPIEIVSLYNALDCFATWKLYELQKKVLMSYV